MAIRNKLLLGGVIMLFAATLLVLYAERSDVASDGKPASVEETDKAGDNPAGPAGGSSSEPAEKPGQKEEGIVVVNPQANETVNSPLKITGYVTGNGWAGFEAQMGSVELKDDQGSVLATGILQASGEWMQLPAHFTTTLQFTAAKESSGQLVFRNENASGLEENDRQFILPVSISASVPQEMSVKVYFSNDQLDPENTCTKVFSVERKVPRKSGSAQAAMVELLKGPTQAERDKGYYTSLNEGVKVQRLVIENGVAKVDFDASMEEGMGGSCRVSAIRQQITETLKQFPTVKEVVISVDGRTEDILQP